MQTANHAKTVQKTAKSAPALISVKSVWHRPYPIVKVGVINALKQPILKQKSANPAVKTAKNVTIREDVPNVMNPSYLRTVNAKHVKKEAIMKLESAFLAVKTV